MRSNLNFTGRSKILATTFSVELNAEEQPPTLTLNLLDGFPDVAMEQKLVVEVFGVFEAVREVYSGPIQPRSVFVIPLDTLRDPLASRIRIFVVRDQIEKSLIEHAVDNVAPNILGNTEEEQESFLPIVRKGNLGLAWQITYPGFTPQLEIDNTDGLAASLLGNPIFEKLVLPQVVNSVYMWIASLDESASDEGSLPDWLKFFSTLGVESPFEAAYDSEDNQDQNILIANATQAAVAFSKNQNYIDSLLRHFKLDQGDS